MPVHHLVRYVSECCVRRKTGGTLYHLTQKYGWKEEDVMLFLRSQKAPTKKVLREMCRELEITQEYAEKLLRRG